jgi:hypothetical protein
MYRYCFTNVDGIVMTYHSWFLYSNAKVKICQEAKISTFAFRADGENYIMGTFIGSGIAQFK